MVLCASLHLGCQAEDCDALPAPRAFVLLDEDDAEATISTEGDCEEPRCDAEGETGCISYSFRMASYTSECALAITFADGTETTQALTGTEADDCGQLVVRVGYE